MADEKKPAAPAQPAPMSAPYAQPYNPPPGALVEPAPAAYTDDELATPPAPSGPGPTQANTRIDVRFGPYRGQALDLPSADAAIAVSQKWARLSYPGDPWQELTDVETQQATQAAEDAAPKLRAGEDLTQPTGQAGAGVTSGAASTRDMRAGGTGRYPTKAQDEK